MRTAAHVAHVAHEGLYRIMRETLDPMQVELAWIVLGRIPLLPPTPEVHLVLGCVESAATETPTSHDPAEVTCIACLRVHASKGALHAPGPREGVTFCLANGVPDRLIVESGATCHVCLRLQMRKEAASVHLIHNNFVSACGRLNIAAGAKLGAEYGRTLEVEKTTCLDCLRVVYHRAADAMNVRLVHFMGATEGAGACGAATPTQEIRSTLWQEVTCPACFRDEVQALKENAEPSRHFTRSGASKAFCGLQLRDAAGVFFVVVPAGTEPDPATVRRGNCPDCFRAWVIGGAS